MKFAAERCRHRSWCTFRTDVHLAAVNEDERIITLTGHGSWWAGAVEDLKDEKLQRIT